MDIPFTKLHGAENDFLLTWREDAPPSGLPEVARRICARHTGIGADGWLLLDSMPGGLRTQLFNSDGSEAEISGNGTRCAAAFALLHELTAGPEVKIDTAAGTKSLHIVKRSGRSFEFEMDMGTPVVEELHARLTLAKTKFDATILNVGNPQCAIFVDSFPSNWQEFGALAEAHPRFPQHSNVSFVRTVSRHTIEARFYERGAGETRSSGTGSTGAAVAAILRGVCATPVEVRTPAGSLRLRWDDSVFLTGPAEVVSEGRFFLEL